MFPLIFPLFPQLKLALGVLTFLAKQLMSGGRMYLGIWVPRGQCPDERFLEPVRVSGSSRRVLCVSRNVFGDCFKLRYNMILFTFEAVMHVPVQSCQCKS